MVVELATSEGVVIAGLVDIRPEEARLVLGCLCVVLPTDAGEVGPEVFFHVALVVQESDAFGLGLGRQGVGDGDGGLLVGPGEVDGAVQSLDFAPEAVSLVLEARLEDLGQGNGGFISFGYFF